MKRQHTGNGPSQRQLRVGEQLKHILAEEMQRFDLLSLMDDDAPMPMLTVTEIRPSPDLRQATVYVVTMDDRDIAHVLQVLNERAPMFQKAVGKQLSMKFTPRLTFKQDQSFENSQRINQLLSEVHRSDNS